MASNEKKKITKTQIRVCMCVCIRARLKETVKFLSSFSQLTHRKHRLQNKYNNFTLFSFWGNLSHWKEITKMKCLLERLG